MVFDLEIGEDRDPDRFEDEAALRETVAEACADAARDEAPRHKAVSYQLARRRLSRVDGHTQWNTGEKA